VIAALLVTLVAARHALWTAAVVMGMVTVFSLQTGAWTARQPLFQLQLQVQKIAEDYLALFVRRDKILNLPA
jgi:hypothetical protein